MTHNLPHPLDLTASPHSADLSRVVGESPRILAKTYDELHALGVLDALRAASPVPFASPESLSRAVLQCVEIALLNLADLLQRAVADLERNLVQKAMVKLLWARGFHRLLSSLSLLPGQLSGFLITASPRNVLRISDSPAYQRYFEVLRRFDREMERCIDSGHLEIDEALAERSLEDPELQLVQALRICNHETTIWESHLAQVSVTGRATTWEQLIDPEGIADAVYERGLEGDTCCTQFRGLHQIPETLGEEASDHCEQAIRELRADHLEDALEHLGCVNVLARALLAALPPMVDNLTTSDYHAIRAGLGPVSSSHSVCLRYHLFNDLYEQLWEVMAVRLTGKPADQVAEEEVAAAVARVDGERVEDRRYWLKHLLINDCLDLRSTIFHWRDQHLHLPRNSLGGPETRSLAGAPDAVEEVRKMRQTARLRDPMAPLARARGLNAPLAEGAGELSLYLESEASLDSSVLAHTGKLTRQRFPQVQERRGIFADRCPFSPPPRRRA